MIAVVDDYPDAAAFLVRLLQRSGFRSSSFHSCESLLATLATGGPIPSLIILDLHLPTMNGVECLKALQRNARWREIPVILYTADNHSPLLDQAVQLGARDVIVKGALEWDDFLSTIRKHRRPATHATDTSSQH